MRATRATKSGLTQAPATEELVQHYYRALETARSEIASFFVPTAAASTNGEGVPAILYCGNAVPSAADLQTLFEKEMPPMHFEAQVRQPLSILSATALTSRLPVHRLPDHQPRHGRWHRLGHER